METTCRDWFKYLKNNDFGVDNKECSGTLEKFEDDELEALLHEDSCQAQAELAQSLGVDPITVLKCLEALGMIKKENTLGAVWVKAKRHQSASCHMWTATSTVEKERYCNQRWKVDTLR